MKRALRADVTIIGRLRKDAAFRDLPRKPRRGQRRKPGRPPKYGKNKISLVKRAAHRDGWETVRCTVYGKTITKLYKTFLATYRPTGGVIRVVIVEEERNWFPFFSTDPSATAVEIIEAFADRSTIEQDFHDVKEVWGAGQQQVQNIWTNVAVYHLNLWIHTLSIFNLRECDSARAGGDSSVEVGNRLRLHNAQDGMLSIKKSRRM